MPADAADSSQTLPCVVQVGFAGSRRLFDDPVADPDEQRVWQEAIADHLANTLRSEVPAKLRLAPHHFLCGISQIASGADMLFAQACARLQIPQRIFLPQPIEDYLAAVGSGGEPDFAPKERAEAKRHLESAHVIQVVNVSQSVDRNDRFRETNAEILRVSDVIICLQREDASGSAGGTEELRKRAEAIGTPVLEIRVAVQDGQASCQNAWHLRSDQPFQPPTIPPPLDRLTFEAADQFPPTSEQYCAPLKALGSTQAKAKQQLFQYSAAAIIGTHILATILAACLPLSQWLAGPGPDASSGHSGGLVLLFLGLEIALLAAGLLIHQYLQRSKAARIWANARVVAELARSIRAIQPRHIYLGHLFRLALPHRFRPLLRTLNVIHLRSTYGVRDNSSNAGGDRWKSHRDDYLRKRIEHQIRYYNEKLAKDTTRLHNCERMFMVFSWLALTATAIKFIMLVAATQTNRVMDPWPEVLGILAVVFPVLAVAGVSWASALDFEARIETFQETLHHLKRQQELIKRADTAAEFDKLLLETETVLLGENANWFSRRANTGVN